MENIRQIYGPELAEVIRRMMPGIDHEGRIELFRTFCDTLGRYFLENGVFALAAYEIAEEAGLHVTPVHFYSPLASRDEVKAQSACDLFGSEFGLRFDRQAQHEFLKSHVLPFLPELTDVPIADPATSGRFFWSNGMFSVQDAVTLYGIIRAMQPKQVLEVGSGYSTLLAAMAAARNGSTSVTCIEPFPTGFWNRHLRQAEGYTLIEQIVQDVPIETFQALRSGDILFLDSSHVVKPGSDVEHLIFRVLPVLAPGVIVHFHDIFLPKGYVDHFYLAQHRHWNENYVLAAFLANNRDWEVLVANAFIADDGTGQLLADLAQALAGGDPGCAAGLFTYLGGGSLWLRRRQP
jgi:predicted O-methyltransferase YrrM